MEIPMFLEVDKKYRDGKKLNPLEEFVYENFLEDYEDEVEWHRTFKEALDFYTKSKLTASEARVKELEGELKEPFKKAPAIDKKPRWTILYNRIQGEWVGGGWEFFDDETLARNRVDSLKKEGAVPTLRPYYHDCDYWHLGAAHQIITPPEDEGEGE